MPSRHHVEEEESKVLPAIRSKLSAQRRAELADAFAARESHLGEQPGDLRKTDLEQQAANIGITGASQKSKGELSEELSRKAEEIRGVIGLRAAGPRPVCSTGRAG